jgi:hypothetical protein
MGNGLMKLDEATTNACKEKTLIEALTHIAVWESERAIQQALASKGDKWNTCFRTCFESVIKQWQTENESKTIDLIRNLEATKILFQEMKDAARNWKPTPEIKCELKMRCRVGGCSLYKECKVKKIWPD